MFRDAGAVGLVLALAGCTYPIVLDDVHDAGVADAFVPKDAQSDSDASCAEKYTLLKFVPQPAQLLIVVDRSSDMQRSFDSTTREAAAQDALASAVDAFAGKIKFGFEQFPADPTVSQCTQGSCCAGSVIDPAIDNASTMKSSILCSDPKDLSCSVASTDSPSDAALAKVRDYYKANPTTDDLYILLVTSSEPSCAGEDQCSSARSAANDLGDENVRIIVLSVDYQPDSWSCLYQIGRRGWSPRASQLLYSANSTSDLSSYLSEIFSAVARSACTLNSDSGIVPPGQAQLLVWLGKTPVSQTDWNNQDGWSATPNQTTITLSGSACDNYLSSQDKLQVGYNACTSQRP
jgi:hypothetical protein